MASSSYSKMPDLISSSVSLEIGNGKKAEEEERFVATRTKDAVQCTNYNVKLK